MSILERVGDDEGFDHAQLLRAARRREDLVRSEGKYDKALEELRKAQELAKKADSRNLDVAILHKEGLIALGQGRLDEAREAFERSLVLARQLDQTANVMVLELNIADIHVRRCNIEEAMRLYREVLQFMEDAGRTADVRRVRARLEQADKSRGVCVPEGP